MLIGPVKSSGVAIILKIHGLHEIVDVARTPGLIAVAVNGDFLAGKRSAL